MKRVGSLKGFVCIAQCSFRLQDPKLIILLHIQAIQCASGHRIALNVGCSTYYTVYGDVKRERRQRRNCAVGPQTVQRSNN